VQIFYHAFPIINHTHQPVAAVVLLFIEDGCK